MKWMKYPKLSSLLTYPDEKLMPLLNTNLFWEIKRDGSNISLTFNQENKEIMIYSRNGLIRDIHLKQRVEEIINALRDKLIHFFETYPTTILYGEYIYKGNSPAGTEYHETPEYILFDVFMDIRFLYPTEKYELLNKFDLPYIPPILVTTASTIKELIEQRKEALKKTEGKYEGVVLKCLDAQGHYRIFKEKHEKPVIPKIKGKKKDNKNVLPVLELSEIMSEINQLYQEEGEEKFLDKKYILPKIAERVEKEAKIRGRRRPRNIYPYYLKFLEDRRLGKHDEA